MFYDSLLPHIAAPDEMDRVSTAGYAIGYLGGGVLLRHQPAVDSEPDDVRPAGHRRGHQAVVRQRRRLVAGLLDSRCSVACRSRRAVLEPDETAGAELDSGRVRARRGRRFTSCAAIARPS